MLRPGRAAVEVLLWLGVLAGLSLLLTWWEVRPGAPGDLRPAEGGGTRSLFTGSFLLVTAATTLVLWLRNNLPLARIAAGVTGLAMLIGGGSWADIADAEYVGWVLRLGGVALWALILRSSVWEEQPPPRPIPRVAAIVLLVLIVPLVGYGLLAMAIAVVEGGLLDESRESEPGWYFLAPVVLAMALLVPALRVVVTDLLSRREDVRQITENGA